MTISTPYLASYGTRVFYQQYGSRECMSGLVGLLQVFCVEHIGADSSARNLCLFLRTFFR